MRALTRFGLHDVLGRATVGGDLPDAVLLGIPDHITLGPARAVDRVDGRESDRSAAFNANALELPSPGVPERDRPAVRGEHWRRGNTFGAANRHRVEGIQ